MRVPALAAAAFFLTAIDPAHAMVRISNDPGGQIGPYIDRFTSLRHSGQKIMIDGPCLSACTLLLGLVPRDRICVTRRAKFGFHAAWNPSPNGGRVVSQAGTQILWEIYPREVRAWLKRRGGLKPRMVYLHGRELASICKPC